MGIIKEIFVNICIMFTLLFACHNILYKKHKKFAGKVAEPVVMGLITGAFGCALILFRVIFSNYISIDLRSIALVLATLSGGALAVGIATIILIIFRLFIFGYSYTALVGAITIGASGIACILLTKVKLKATTMWYLLYGVTALSTLAGLLWVAAHNTVRLETFIYFIGLNTVGAIVSCEIYKYLLKTQEAYLALETEAITDGLTKLYNKRYYNHFLEESITHMNETKEPFSIIVFDIDHFKRVNDTYGHEAGDEVLKEISSIAKKLVSAPNVLCRIGGEEFSIVMPRTDEEEAVALAEKLRKKVEAQPFRLLDNKLINITISLGVSNTPHSVASPYDLFKTADEALYQSKNSGRNKVSLYKAYEVYKQAKEIG